jgi:hypothetical protein
VSEVNQIHPSKARVFRGVQLLAEAMLDNAVLKDLASKKW